MIKRCPFRHIIVWVTVACLILFSTFQNESYFLSLETVMKPQEQSSQVHEPHKRPEKTILSLPFNNSPPSNFQPIASLASRKNCEPDPNQPRSPNIYSFKNYENASSFWMHLDDKSTDDLPVVCEFDDTQTASTHFPHTMQQLYGCFSYWQEYPQRQAILLLNKKTKKKLERNQFLKGFLQLLKTQIPVDIIDKQEFEQKNYSVISQTISVSGGYILAHARTLNEMVQKQYKLPSSFNATFCPHKKPRISILNRRKSVGRSIINAELLTESESIKSASWKGNLVVEYFEDFDFEEQVSFFQETDILIAPHGAQLTGVAFLGNPCSQLVEVFPKVNQSLKKIVPCSSIFSPPEFVFSFNFVCHGYY